MADFTLVDGATLAPADLHAATVAAFSDYLAGPFQMTLEQFPNFIARQGVDLARSRAALVGGRIGAFAFIAPRNEVGRWRLAVMGALPQARGSGAAPALLDDFVARAAAEGMSHAELECFADNERALRLYRGRGFSVACALNGRKAPACEGAGPHADASRAGPPAGMHEVDRTTALAWLAAADLRIANLPFPNSARCMAAQVRPLTFWRCGTAQLTFSVVDGTPVQVHGLIDLDPAQGDAHSLAQALRATHADADIVVPPIQRDDLGGAALQRAGFALNGLHQVLMTRALG